MIDRVLEQLSEFRFPFGNEAALQLSVEAVLNELELAHRREVILGKKDRIDFLLECAVGIECKVDGSANAVLDQCARYLEYPTVSGLILLTSRATHRSGLQTLMDKPFRVLWICDP